MTDVANSATPTNSAPAQEGADASPGTEENQESQTQEAEKPKPQKRFIKTKVHGKEESVDEDTLVRSYQKVKAAEERFEHASKIERNMQAFIQRLQEDPDSILSDSRFNINREELANKWLRQKIEAELEDPKDREIREAKERLKKYEDKELTAKQRQEQEELEERKQQITAERLDHFRQKFSKALGNTQLAKDEETEAAALRGMALAYRLAKKAGYDASPEELAHHVEAQYFKSMHSAASNLSGQELVDFLGESTVNKIRLYDLERFEGKQSKRESPAPRDNYQYRDSSEKKLIDPTDWRMKIRDGM